MFPDFPDVSQVCTSATMAAGTPPAQLCKSVARCRHNATNVKVGKMPRDPRHHVLPGSKIPGSGFQCQSDSVVDKAGECKDCVPEHDMIV